MGQVASAAIPEKGPPPLKGILRNTAAATTNLDKSSQSKKKVTFTASVGPSLDPVPYYSSQIGIQCFIVVNQDKSGVDCYLDTSSLADHFARITASMWQHDQIHIRRLSVGCAINPTHIPLGFTLYGFQCSDQEYHQECRNSTAKSKGIPFTIPPFASGQLDICLYEETSSFDTKSLCVPNLNLTLCWTLNNGSSPKHLAQWMTDERKPMFCVSIILNVIYSIEPHPNSVFTVVSL